MARNEHLTIYAYDNNGNALYKPKRGYNTENEALMVCYRYNIQDYTIHKAVTYKCSVCGKWHIGHHTTILNLEDKQKIKTKFDKFKTINGIK